MSASRVFLRIASTRNKNLSTHYNTNKTLELSRPDFTSNFQQRKYHKDQKEDSKKQRHQSTSNNNQKYQRESSIPSLLGMGLVYYLLSRFGYLGLTNDNIEKKITHKPVEIEGIIISSKDLETIGDKKELGGRLSGNIVKTKDGRIWVAKGATSLNALVKEVIISTMYRLIGGEGYPDVLIEQTIESNGKASYRSLSEKFPNSMDLEQLALRYEFYLNYEKYKKAPTDQEASNFLKKHKEAKSILNKYQNTPPTKEEEIQKHSKAKWFIARYKESESGRGKAFIKKLEQNGLKGVGVAIAMDRMFDKHQDIKTPNMVAIEEESGFRVVPIDHEKGCYVSFEQNPARNIANMLLSETLVNCVHPHQIDFLETKEPAEEITFYLNDLKYTGPHPLNGSKAAELIKPIIIASIERDHKTGAIEQMYENTANIDSHKVIKAAYSLDGLYTQEQKNALTDKLLKKQNKVQIKVHNTYNIVGGRTEEGQETSSRGARHR